jgi:hypothetical protein
VVSSLQAFQLKFCTHFSSPHARYMSRPFHTAWFDNPNDCYEHRPNLNALTFIKIYHTCNWCLLIIQELIYNRARKSPGARLSCSLKILWRPVFSRVFMFSPHGSTIPACSSEFYLRELRQWRQSSIGSMTFDPATWNLPSAISSQSLTFPSYKSRRGFERLISLYGFNVTSIAIWS